MKWGDDRGQAGLEMLAVLLILVPVLLGALSLVQGFSARHALEHGTAVAARRIALQPAGWGAALAGVQSAVDGALLGNAAPVACQVLDAGGSATDPTTLAFGTTFAVTCRVPFQARIPWVATAPRILTATHYEVLERYP